MSGSADPTEQASPDEQTTAPLRGAPGRPRTIDHPTLGKYELLREVGRGGHAVVYEALDPTLGRRVALKLLLGEGDSETAIKRLQREATVAAALSHPGIVPVHEVGRLDTPEGTWHYIALAFVDGPTLAGALPGLSLPRRLAALEQVAEAVGHAHAHGVVHRDLKPANILLAEDGRALVTDFGLARWDEAQTRLTESGTVMGTACYMSPEQVRAEREAVDARTDVWAMGVMLYEALTGQRPFHSHSAAEVMQAILHHDPPPPRSLQPGVARELEAICLVALSKPRRGRYADCAALAEELRRHRTGAGITARYSSRLYGIRRRLRRPRALLALALVALCGVGLAGWQLWQRSGRRRALRSLQETNRRGLAAARARRRAEQQQRERLARLEQVARPLARELEQTRQLFYVPDIDIRAKLDQLERSLGELQRLAGDLPGGATPRIWGMLGVGWYLVGRARRAEQALRAALALAPEDGRAHHYLGRIYLERALAVMLIRRHAGNPAQIDRLSRRWSDLAATHLGRGAKDWSPRPIDRLITAVYRAISRRQTQRVLALCQEGRRRFGQELGAEEFSTLAGWVTPGEAAIPLWREALARRPHYAWGQLSLGMGYQRAARWTEAIAAYLAALKVNPHLALAHNNLGIVYLLTGRLKPALARFDRALEIEPRLTGAHYNRGLVLYDLQRTPASIRAFDEALALYPGFAPAYVWRAAGKHRIGKSDEALRDLARALQLDPTEARAHKFRGNVYGARGKLREALAEYDRAIAIDARYGEAYNDRAHLYRRLKKPDRAWTDIERAIALRPGLAVAWFNRGTMKKDRRDLAGALADYTRAVELDPRHASAWAHRGSIRLLRGDPDGAIADYDRAIALEPEEGLHYVNRGGAYFHGKRDPRRALVDLERAVALVPADWSAWSTYAYCLQALGRKAEAIAALRRARPLVPPLHRFAIDALIEEMKKR